MSDDLPVEYVSIGQLRAMFNEARLWHRVMSDDLFPDVEVNGHPSPPLSDDPICTRSQIVAYRDDAWQLKARVHQYVRPDGRLGGTGQRPDPQEMVGEDGVLYVGIRYPDAEEGA